MSTRVRVGVLMSYVCIECRRRMFFDRRLQKWICTACGAECSASDITNADTLPVSAVVASSTGAHANTNSLLVPERRIMSRRILIVGAILFGLLASLAILTCVIRADDAR